MKTTFIYILKCPKTGDIRYVGKSNNPKHRYNAHMRTDNTASCHKINWIQKLLKEGLKPELEILEEVSEENWKERERYYISKYRELYDLTNCKDGGEGLFKGNQTSFKKGHISLSKGTGKKKKCAVCKNLFEVSPSRYDVHKCCSKECSSIHRSENPNEGCFKKGSISWNKGKSLKKNSSRSKSIIQIDLKTNEILNVFPSAAEAERQTGIKQHSITSNTNGKSKSSGGFKWEKKDKDSSMNIGNKVSALKGKMNGGSSKKIKQINKFTGIIINEFPSAAEASRQTGIKLSNILNNSNGTSMSAGGFKWEKGE
jgi:hypothetical protein